MKNVMRFCLVFLAACAIGTATTPIFSASRTFLISEPVEKALLINLSGENALRFITQLVQWDRTTSSSGYLQAVRFVEAELRNAGVEVRVEEYGADQGRMAFQLRPSPYWPPVGWNVRKAELWVVSPGKQKIADYSVQPIQLARYSRSGNVEAELVDVGVGTREEDYRDLDLRGKVVLATGAPQSVQLWAVKKYGAAGSITWGLNDSYSPGKDDPYPDLVGWQVLNPRTVDGFEPSFAFSISRKAGHELRESLKAGPVRVRAQVDATFSDVPLATPVARIAGTDDTAGEFLFVAHIDHVRPSANDNASGAALLLEIARGLNQAIRDGGLPAPRRSILFLWVSEGPGTLGYVTHHPESRERIVGALNLDMVGENAATTHSMLRLSRTPDSLPSFMPDVVEHMLRWVDSMPIHEPTGSRNFLNFRIQPFSPSSDHYLLNDGVLKIPALMLNFAPDDFHHTNLDTPDKCDPTELKRVGLAAASSAYFLASAGGSETAQLAREVAARGKIRMFEVQRQGERMLYSAPREERVEVLRLVSRWIRHTALREQGAVASTLRLNREPPQDQLVTGLASEMAKLAQEQQAQLEQYWTSLTGDARVPELALTDDERVAATLVPVLRKEFMHHNWERSMDPARTSDEDRTWLAGYRQRLYQAYMRIPEFLNFIDGKRDLLFIRDAVSVERFNFSEGLDQIGTWEGLDLAHSRIDAGQLIRLMTIFEKQGWLELKRAHEFRK
ncbi:MAG: M28 family peptidase [Acidobacteria bacterium]|nr:M28 family peptidase [Acidobacteriota bacterium]